MSGTIEDISALTRPSAGWVTDFTPLRRENGAGSVALKVSEPGIAVFSLRGVMDLELAKGFTEQLEALYSHLAANNLRSFMVLDSVGLERLSFQAQRHLLGFGKREVPDIAGMHCAIANPVFRALIRLFRQIMPQGNLLLHIHPSCEAALGAVRDRLRLLQAPLGDTGPELTAEAFVSEHLSLRYFQPAAHILLCVSKGVLNASGARHMLEVHARLLGPMRERHGRACIVFDTRELRHTTVEGYRALNSGVELARPQPGDVICVISRYWPRAVEALTRRLLRSQGFSLRIVASLPEALAAAGHYAGPAPQAVPAARGERLPWFGLRRRMTALHAENAALHAERETFLREAGTLLADILLHKDSAELHQISALQQTGPFQELYESLYLLQSEYQEYLQTLQQEIDERIAAERQAAELSQIKSRFLASVSHELRTPMNAIIGFTTLLMRGKAGAINPQQRLYVERVHDNSMHLLALINDVLDISKIEAGAFSLYREAIAMPAFLERILEPLRAVAQRKDLSLVLEIDPAAAPTLSGDPDRLRQIVTNLVDNAIKFTERGGITVRYRAWPSATHPLAIEVSDTGIGIASADQKKIFEAFTQLHGSSHPGAGLGLSICLSLVHALGYRLELESAPGQGSLFRLQLTAP